jgi:hypothetical protein
MTMITEETRKATTPSPGGYGWQQEASYLSDTPLPFTSIQLTPLPSPHSNPATGECIKEPQIVSTVASELVTVSDNLSAAEHFHTFATN